MGGMQDAGVPLRRRVAGVAMGLILDEAAPEGAVILTDIMGVEDALGDMDFKVAGDAASISALQMDIKVEGITIATMRRALVAAREGRQRILADMDACRPPPRHELSKYCPRILSLPLPENQIGALIGPGGALPHKAREACHQHKQQQDCAAHYGVAIRGCCRAVTDLLRSNDFRVFTAHALVLSLWPRSPRPCVLTVCTRTERLGLPCSELEPRRWPCRKADQEHTGEV